MSQCSIINDVKGQPSSSIFPSSFYERYETSKTKTECSHLNIGTLSVYEGDVEWILDGFLMSELIRGRKSGLSVKGPYYILSSPVRLTWNNIKRLSTDDLNINDDSDDMRPIYTYLYSYFTEGTLSTPDDWKILLKYIKGMFWYFRKAIVDTILSDIILKADASLIAVSVGSTKLTSDYDITLDGDYGVVAKVIYDYNNTIKKLFHDESDKVFDTNVYGVAFFKYGTTEVESPKVMSPSASPKTNTGRAIDNAFSESFTCNNINIRYMKKKREEMIASQHVWALVKLFLKLYTVYKQDEKVYDLFLQDIKKDIDATFFFLASEIINTYTSDTSKYQDFIEYINRKDFKKSINESDVSNFISFINYNGSETYFTQGAFLDVVVNQQMCSNSKTISLSIHDYLDSFIENMSDFMTHYHKDKYLERAEKALVQLPGYGDLNVANTNKTVSDTIKDVKHIITICSVDIIKCQPFLIMNKCISCITTVFSKYIADHPHLAEKVVTYKPFLLSLTSLEELHNIT
jgi:hypothetical protein